MRMNFAPLICYYDGELQHSSRDPIYVGGHTRADWVNKNISFTEFVGKMHELCNSPPEEATIDIKCRYLLDLHTSIAMHVEDDSSLSIIMDMHPHQCNAIVVYVEKRRAQKSSSTTQRHEIHSSSFGNGHRIHMANTLEELNVNQLPSTLVIDLHSTGSRVPSSLPRYGTFELEKEIELSTASKLQGQRQEEYTITCTVTNEHLEESTGVSSKDLVDRFLFDPSEQCLKPVEGDTMSSVVWSREWISKRYSSPSRQMSKQMSTNDVVYSEAIRIESNSWFPRKVLDPQNPYLQKWNKIFGLSCMLAFALDALFFYTPRIDIKKRCLDWDSRLEITACLLRSFIDIVYVVHIGFQFCTGYMSSPSYKYQRSFLVKDLGAIARRYLFSFFLIDILSVLPLPQVIILIIMPRVKGSTDVRKENSLHYVVLLQYIPRFLRIYPLYKALRRDNSLSEIAWVGAVFNFSLYMIASHIFGAYWYFLSVERETTCWQYACRNTTTCIHHSLHCGNHINGGNAFLYDSCPVIEPNRTLFDFGIYLDALQSGIQESSFAQKLLYCFWWGLQNLGSLGQNLKPSTSGWEVSFVVSISVFGLFLFILLIGNLQTYLQSDTLKLEKERRRKSQDAEQWMVQYFLPENLRQRIRRYEHCKWNNIRGLDDENILNQLPNDIKSDIKRHLCLDLFKKVSLFERVDENILGAMCDHLKSVIYTENCYIIREGNLAEEIIFITRGSLVSNTTEGGMSAFSRPSFLSPGDICGEELIRAIGHSRVPISRRTVQALTDVNVFVLNEHDLKSVINKFDLLRSKKFQNRLKYLSSQWRAWATCYVQAAWLQYRKKKRHSRRARLLEILPLAFLPKPEELDHC